MAAFVVTMCRDVVLRNAVLVFGVSESGMRNSVHGKGFALCSIRFAAFGLRCSVCGKRFVQ